MEKPPKGLSPEEQSKVEKERVLSDAELIKGGAEYVVDDKGSARLTPRSYQIEETRAHMEQDLNMEEKEQYEKEAQEKEKFEEKRKHILDSIESQEIRIGDLIKVEIWDMPENMTITGSFVGVNEKTLLIGRRKEVYDESTSIDSHNRFMAGHTNEMGSSTKMKTIETPISFSQIVGVRAMYSV